MNIQVVLQYFLLFMIYSIFGWIAEEIMCSIRLKKIPNRGFLIGPYCPIYGFGSILMSIFLEKYQEDPIILFCLSMLLCSILEYLTSYLMEKIFNARWWDYSDRKFNLNGRICLENAILFGVAGFFLICYLNPFFMSLIIRINKLVLLISSLALFIVFMIDTIISFNVMTGIKNTINTMRKEATEDITEKVKDIIMKKSFLSNRLIKAFPDLKAKVDRLKESVNIEKEKLKREINKEKEKIKKELKKEKMKKLSEDKEKNEMEK